MQSTDCTEQYHLVFLYTQLPVLTKCTVALYCCLIGYFTIVYHVQIVVTSKRLSSGGSIHISHQGEASFWGPYIPTKLLPGGVPNISGTVW